MDAHRRKGKTMTKLLLTLIATTTLCLGADPFPGTWKRNVAKSQSTLGAVSEQTNIVEAIPGGYLLKFIVPGGTTLEQQYILDDKPHTLNGKGVVTTTSGADTRVAKRLNDHAYEMKFLRQGKVVATSRTELPKDGKTETVTIDGVNPAGEKFHILWFDEKQ